MPYLISPENPPNANESKPAATNKIGVPFTNAGTGADLIFLRIPLIKIIDSKNPLAVPREYTIDSRKL